MPLCIRSAAGCLSVSLCIQPVDGPWGCLWSLRAHPGIATQLCYETQPVCVPLWKGKCSSCLAMGLPASMVTLWVGCRSKGQWDAPDQLERQDGVILRLSPALLWWPVHWLQTLQSVFLLNRSLLPSEPVCGGPFEGRISCSQHFLLSWVSMGPPGWLKLVSLAAPQQAIWLILKCLAHVFFH